MEIWKDVVGYEGLYQVSSTGRVRSLDREVAHNVGTKHIRGKLKKATCRKRDGYMEVKLSKDNRYRSHKVHRLVAEAFIENPYSFQEVNHRDENPGNNNVENLEWCDHAYNMAYGTRSKRIANKLSRSVKQIQNGHVVKVWKSTKEAQMAGYDSGRISMCCRGKASHHKGFQWEWE